MGEQFSAIILAGGRSSRMGRPKADLDFGGVTLLDRIVAELQRSFHDVVIVTTPADSRLVKGTRVIHDERENEGPLAALGLGLREIQNQGAFVCACDLPFVSSAVARKLCEMLENHDAVIPVIEGVAQPLHAVYNRRCTKRIDAMIARGQKRMMDVIEAVGSRRVEEKELRKIDIELRSFLNVNTPEEYEQALLSVAPS